mgnify:CR=1 FL=1
MPSAYISAAFSSNRRMSCICSRRARPSRRRPHAPGPLAATDSVVATVRCLPRPGRRALTSASTAQIVDVDAEAGPKIATMMASPTATSAAATVITKNTMTLPVSRAVDAPKATNARFAAFSISSMDMKMTSGFRRTKDATTPMVNRIADSPT